MEDPRVFIESIIENIPDMIFVKEAKSLKFVRFNRAGENLLGIPREEMYGKSDYDFFPKDEADFFTSKDREVLAGGRVVEIPEEPLHTQQGQRWLHTRKVPVLDDDGNPLYLLGISTDITESRQAKQELAETKRRLLESEKATLEARLRETQRLESLGIMAGGIAHDFNNFLVPILSNASLLKETVSENQRDHQRIEAILNASQQASELIQHLLAYAGTGETFKKIQNLEKIINEVTAILGIETRQSVTLSIELEEDIPPIMADGAQLRQLLLNLLTNALDAIESRPGRINLRLRVAQSDDPLFSELSPLDSSTTSQDYLLLEVEDTGCGIPPDIRKRIFDPFFSTKPNGHGLGLAAVHGIVKGHGGTISVESKKEQGTCMRVLLRAARGSTVQEGKAVNEPRQHSFTQSRVLVIDDQQAVLQSAEDALTFLGYTVTTAESGEEGIEKIMAEPSGFDLVLLDLTMPTMSGEETLERILDIRLDLPIVLSTGFLKQDAVQRIPAKQLAGVLAKPYTLHDLEKVLIEALQSTQ